MICLGAVLFFLTGGVSKVYSNDFTKISFLIYALFGGFSVYVGVLCYRLSLISILTPNEYKSLCQKAEIAWFAAEKFLVLGMIGTLVGFIYVMGTGFTEMEVGNVATMKIAIQKIGTGMGTALYTTISGLTCGLLLQLQLFLHRSWLRKQGIASGCFVEDESV